MTIQDKILMKTTANIIYALHKKMLAQAKHQETEDNTIDDGQFTIIIYGNDIWHLYSQAKKLYKATEGYNI